MTAYILLSLAVVVPLFGLAQETETWRPVNGFVSSNTIEKRFINYSVGKHTYTTSNESIIELLGQNLGVEFHFRPGQMKTKINGIDPEEGLTVPLFYNPRNHSEAVVLKGWSMAPIVFMFVVSLPMLIRAFAFFGMGWRPSNTTPDNFGY